jgi:hypothetical protein
MTGDEIYNEVVTALWMRICQIETGTSTLTANDAIESNQHKLVKSVSLDQRKLIEVLQTSKTTLVQTLQTGIGEQGLEEQARLDREFYRK